MSAAEESFLSAIASEAARLKNSGAREALLLHHNDADGLCSGAALTKALGRAGLRVRRYCLEKPYPQAVKLLLQDPDADARSAVLVADFGSGMLPELCALNTRGFELYVLDHHGITPCADQHLHLLNCLAHGVRSDPDCCASAIACLFAEALNADNADLAPLGLLGAIGDGFLESGRFSGLHARLAAGAKASGKLKHEGQYLLDFGGFREAEVLKGDVNALGSIAYFEGGPDVAIKGLLDGVNEMFLARADDCHKRLQNALDGYLKKPFLRGDGMLQWFILDERFADFGVKTVGLVCEELIRRGLSAPNKYLAGFQRVPDKIPGLGTIELKQLKVSMRLPPALKQAARDGRSPDLLGILPAAARELRGFVDACHPHAAAVTIPLGEEERLVRALEKKINAGRKQELD